VDEQAIRQWCEQLVTRLPCQHIAPQGQPYLDRYFIAGWRPGIAERLPALYLHHFLASDPQGQVHSHPWPALAIILVGAYREYRCVRVQGREQTEVQDYRAGDINHLAPTDKHRVELLTPDVWTLLVRGPAVQLWQFFPDCV
jgi:hypothetical protein